MYGATAWGIGALTSCWGYGYDYGYLNPYYVVPSASFGYDYSQPVVINNYAIESPEAGGAAQPPPESAAEVAGFQLFDEARAAFKQSDYDQALKLTEDAIQKVPSDPMLHEFGALCLFARGDYARAASVLNALLAVAPGMDWTTLSGLYPDVSVYTQQLRALEAFCKAHPTDAASHFVLAYHYLVDGSKDAAVAMLKVVLAQKPNDEVAKRILESLQAPPPDQTAPTTAEKPATNEPPVPEAAPAPAGPTTDLVGTWTAKRDDNTFELTITEDGHFTWKVAMPKKEPTTITGQYSVDGDVLVLESKTQGTMAAHVASGGADQFQYVAVGALPSDKGLKFERVKK